MKNQNNKTEDFQAVEFMRQARSKLSEEYLTDKDKYVAYVRQAMADFKQRQNKANH